ncbi:hypothetical protein BH11PLA1_BH11PLA1_20800 [soil metagenome]
MTADEKAAAIAAVKTRMGELDRAVQSGKPVDSTTFVKLPSLLTELIGATERLDAACMAKFSKPLADISPFGKLPTPLEMRGGSYAPDLFDYRVKNLNRVEVVRMRPQPGTTMDWVRSDGQWMMDMTRVPGQNAANEKLALQMIHLVDDSAVKVSAGTLGTPDELARYLTDQSTSIARPSGTPPHTEPGN